MLQHCDICCQYTVPIKPSEKIEHLPIICCQTRSLHFACITCQESSKYSKLVKEYTSTGSLLPSKAGIQQKPMQHTAWIKFLPHAIANSNFIAFIV